MKEKKLFNEDGNPSVHGLKSLQFIKDEVELTFDSLSLTSLSDAQVRLLGSWLHKLIGNKVTDILASRTNK
jgi:hypothetical protein